MDVNCFGKRMDYELFSEEQWHERLIIRTLAHHFTQMQRARSKKLGCGGISFIIIVHF